MKRILSLLVCWVLLICSPLQGQSVSPQIGGGIGFGFDGGISGKAGTSPPSPPAGLALSFRPINAVSTPNVSAGSHTALQFERTQAWTVIAQINVATPPTAAANPAAIIFTTANQGSANTAFPGYELWIDNLGRLRVRLINNIATPNYIGVIGTTNVAQGVPHTVAASYDGSSTVAGVKIYVDGVLETMTSEGTSLTASILNTQPLVIGNQLGFPFSLGGTLANFSLSTVVRTQAQIAAYTTAAGAKDANTILAYDFAEGSGTTTADLSTNGFTGTINGAAWPGSPQVVQTIVNPDSAGTSKTTSTATLVKPIAAGNSAIVTVVVAGAGTMTLKDNNGVDYSADLVATGPGPSGVIAKVFVLPNLTTVPTAFTATLSAAGTFWRVRVDEITNVAASPLDGATAAFQSAPGTGANAISSGNITTTANGDFIFGVTMFDSTSVNSLLPGTGFFSLGGGGTDGITAEQLLQSAAGAISATFTQAVASQATTAVVAFKQSGTPPPTCSNKLDFTQVCNSQYLF
jgi:hypothetical protein